jgi:hypothetical protein
VWISRKIEIDSELVLSLEKSQPDVHHVGNTLESTQTIEPQEI